VECGIKLNEFGQRLLGTRSPSRRGGGRLGCDASAAPEVAAGHCKCGDEEVGPFRFSVAQSWVGF